jgi:hypothetical protein
MMDAGPLSTMVREDPSFAAYHEAGHAVAYWARRVRFRYVTIRGRYLDRVAPVRNTRIWPWDHAFIAAAGPIAEMRHRGIVWDDSALAEAIDELAAPLDEEDDWLKEPPGDFEIFATSTSLYSPSSLTAHWRAHETGVGRLWPAVDAVALALLASLAPCSTHRFRLSARLLIGDNTMVSKLRGTSPESGQHPAVSQGVLDGGHGIACLRGPRRCEPR